MILVIDIGNTNIVIGVFEGERLLHSWRISTKLRTSDEYGLIIKTFFSFVRISTNDIKGIAISNVVPPISPVIKEMAEDYFKLTPLFVDHSLKTGIDIKYNDPKEVGADRIVNAVAGVYYYKPPLIIVDFGTATTFDAISERNEYIGGAIAPGITLSMETLHYKTAKLPKIEFTKPKEIIGKDTVTSMQSGIFYGYIGLVEGIIKKMQCEFKSNPTVIATGGLSSIIFDHLKVVDKVDDILTLNGLRIIYNLNKA